MRVQIPLFDEPAMPHASGGGDAPTFHGALLAPETTNTPLAAASTLNHKEGWSDGVQRRVIDAELAPLQAEDGRVNGQVIRDIRAHLRLTQADLGALLGGCSPVTVIRYEQEASRPNAFQVGLLMRLHRLAREFDTNGLLQVILRQDGVFTALWCLLTWLVEVPNER